MENYSSFMAKSPEERERQSLEVMWRAVEDAANTIARARRSAEIAHGISTEEFDKRLNEMCEKAYERFGGMNKGEMAMDMLLELMSRHTPDDLAELFK